MKQFLRLLIIHFILVLASIPTYSQTFSDTIYVNPNNSGKEDGTTWERGFSDFTKFNINNYPSNILLLVSPGTYTKGHTNYVYGGSRAILFIKDKSDVTIKKFYYSPLEGEGGQNQVIFDPEDTLQYGLWLQLTDPDSAVQDINIEGIHFTDYDTAAIFVSGYNLTNRIENVDIRFCNFNTTSGKRAIFCQRTSHINIELCTINSELDHNLQNDGIYMQYVTDAVIKNNSITVSNSYSGSTQPHVDCIQVYNSSNILIENNSLNNASDVNFFGDRQGIHITYTSGYIRIFNNIIRSKKGDGLINIHYTEDTDELKIYNNTLYAAANQRVVIGIVYYPIGSNSGHTPFSIMNNIFYKSYINNIDSSGKILLRFANLDTNNINSTKLNHNLYFINSNPDGNYFTGFCKYMNNVYSKLDTVSWNFGDCEDDGAAGNPEFVSSGDLRLQYNSAAKNIGIGLSEISTDFESTPRPYWGYDYDAGAFEREDTQLKIGTLGVDDETPVTHTLTLIGKCWERNSSGNWVVSTDQNLVSKSITIAESSDTNNLNSWEGFIYKWLDGSNNTQNRIAAGFYKISNNLNSSFIYLDLRDAVNYKLNAYILYNNNNESYRYLNRITGQYVDMELREVTRIWDINNNGTNNISDFQNTYWPNALVQVNGLGEHPRLFWGPDNSGTVERKIGYWEQRTLNTRNMDTSIIIVQPNLTAQTVYYRVKNYLNEYTNEVNVLKENLERYFILIIILNTS